MQPNRTALRPFEPEPHASQASPELRAEAGLGELPDISEDADVVVPLPQDQREQAISCTKIVKPPCMRPVRILWRAS